MSNAPEPGASTRFVSLDTLNDEEKKKEKELKEVYEWIGQEPPERAPYEDKYDPRPLFERLQEQKNLKQEKFDDMFKLANQYRGLDESESMFLNDIARERKRREDEKKRQDELALQSFRKYVRCHANHRATETKTTPVALAERSVPIPTIPKNKPRIASAKRKRDAAAALGIARKAPSTPGKMSAGSTISSTKTLENPPSVDHTSPTSSTPDDADQDSRVKNSL